MGRGGFETDDALAALLPLMKQTLAAHQAGLVAPLDGIKDLFLPGSRVQGGQVTDVKLETPHPGPLPFGRGEGESSAGSLREEGEKTEPEKSGSASTSARPAGSLPMFAPGKAGPPQKNTGSGEADQDPGS